VSPFVKGGNIGGKDTQNSLIGLLIVLIVALIVTVTFYAASMLMRLLATGTSDIWYALSTFLNKKVFVQFYADNPLPK
jgi:small neutral amino acid transporter SnatA (MarC family)